MEDSLHIGPMVGPMLTVDSIVLYMVKSIPKGDPTPMVDFKPTVNPMPLYGGPHIHGRHSIPVVDTLRMADPTISA